MRCFLVGGILSIALVFVSSVVIALDPSITRDLVFPGSQDYSYGTTQMERVKQIFDKILEKRERGVMFNQDRLGPYIKGGTCSSMSLDFVTYYILLKREKAMMTIEDLQQLGRSYLTSNQEMRDRQEAFNSIEIKFEEIDLSVDIFRNKVQSLANLHGLRIDFASGFVDMEKISFTKFEKFIHQLPRGTFIIRTIQHANNHKGEVSGHMMIYNHDKHIPFLYDPNCGMRQLDESTLARVVYNGLAACNTQFNTNIIRFYRISTK